MPEPDVRRRSPDRGVAASCTLELREVMSRCAKQRAEAELQRDGARFMSEEAHAMRARSRRHLRSAP